MRQGGNEVVGTVATNLHIVRQPLLPCVARQFAYRFCTSGTGHTEHHVFTVALGIYHNSLLYAVAHLGFRATEGTLQSEVGSGILHLLHRKGVLAIDGCPHNILSVVLYNYRLFPRQVQCISLHCRDSLILLLHLAAS